MNVTRAGTIDILNNKIIQFLPGSLDNRPVQAAAGIKRDINRRGNRINPLLLRNIAFN